jgi:hypothetical protein
LSPSVLCRSPKDFEHRVVGLLASDYHDGWITVDKAYKSRARPATS